MPFQTEVLGVEVTVERDRHDRRRADCRGLQPRKISAADPNLRSAPSQAAATGRGMDRRLPPVDAREVAVARALDIDREKLRAALRKLGDEYVFYMLDEAIELLPPAKLLRRNGKRSPRHKRVTTTGACLTSAKGAHLENEP